MPLPSWKEWREGDSITENVEPEPVLLNVEPVPDQMGKVFEELDLNQKILVWINDAELKTLQEVKGIGPKSAQKILSLQPYSKLEDVPISKRILEKMRIFLKETII